MTAPENTRTPASPTDTEGKTFAGFANWFESMPADHPVTITVADIRRWAQEAGKDWTSALSTAASPGSDMVAEVIAALEDLLVLCEHGDFRNGVLDQTGSIDEGEVCAGEYISRAEAALTSLKASALPSGDGWQDIASAPRDRLIDIWVSGPGARRIADCRWGKPSKANWGDRYGDDKNLPEQWITLGGFALDRRNGRATHWRPLPDPPGTLKPSAISASPEGRTEVSADHPLAKALRASPETVERIRRMDEQNAIAAARSKDFIVGSSSASPAVGEEDKRPFLNRVRSLFNIDGSLLPELTAEQQREFIRDPVRYFIGTDKVQSDAIWREVLRRNV